MRAPRSTHIFSARLEIVARPRRIERRVFPGKSALAHIQGVAEWFKRNNMQFVGDSFANRLMKS